MAVSGTCIESHAQIPDDPVFLLDDHCCNVRTVVGKGNPFFKLEREGHSRVYEIQCFWIFEPGFETGFQDPAVFVTTIGDYLKRIFVFAHGEIYRV